MSTGKRSDGGKSQDLRGAHSTSETGSPLVALSYLGAGLLNIAFLKEMAVLLPVDGFGAAMTALSAPFAITLLALAARADTATGVASLKGQAGETIARRRVDPRTRRVLLVTLILSLIAALLPFERWCHLPDRFLMSLGILAAGGVFVFMSYLGALLGARRDFSFAALLLLEPILRCGALLGLHAGNWGDSGSGPVVATLASLMASIVLCRCLLPRSTDDSGVKESQPLLASPSALLAFGAFGLLVAIDIPLMRHLLPPEAASRYAAVAVASRFLLLLPFPICLLLAFQLRRRMISRTGVIQELFKTMAMVGTGLAITVLLIHEFAPQILDLLLDSGKYMGLSESYARYSIAAGLFGASLPLVFSGIAFGQISLALLPTTAAGLEVYLLCTKGTSIGNAITVLQVIAGVNLALLATVVLLPLLVVRRLGGRKPS